MKNSWLTGLMMAMVASSACAFDIGLYGSWWNPADADDVFGPGIRVSGETLPLVVRATYYDDIELDRGPSLEDFVIDAGLSLGIDRLDAVDIAVGGGVSYHILDADHGSVDDEVGWYASVLAEVPLFGSFRLFGELLYRGVEIDDFNADLDGTVVNVGIMLR